MFKCFYTCALSCQLTLFYLLAFKMYFPIATEQQQFRQNYPNAYQQSYVPNNQNEYQKQLAQIQQQQQQFRQTHQQLQMRPQQGPMRPIQPDGQQITRYSPARQPPSPQNNFDNRQKPAAMIYQQQQQQQQQAKIQEELRKLAPDRVHNKCRISIPKESLKNYKNAIKIEEDSTQQLLLIETCCSGYSAMRWRGNIVCRPICENCQNGYCKAPEECQCYDGFVQNDNGDCVFTCPMGCLNGRCYLDGSCLCDSGYKLDETRKFCRPICSSGCGQSARHNCTEPDVCGCAKGYQLTDQGCTPVCQPDCGIGGYCEDNNKCQCENGYYIKDGVCQAECYQSCDNGICFSQNRCICNEGYAYNERTTQCVRV